MAKKHPHRKKRIPKLIRTRRFSAVVAILVVVVSAGLGYLWLRGSNASGPITTVNMGVYDRTGGGKTPIAGVRAQMIITGFLGEGCISAWTTTRSDGIADSAGGFACATQTTSVNARFNFPSLPSGMYVDPSSPAKPGTPVNVAVGSNSIVEFWFLANDSDKDGTPDRSDRCLTQVGPASNGGCPAPAPAPAPAAASAPKPAASTAKPKSTTPSTSGGRVATTAQPNGDSAAPAAPTDSTPPSAPTELKLASPSSGSVTLTWVAATDDTGITRYSVERSEDKTAWDMLDDNVTETTYTDTGAAYSRKYYYRVVAYDAATNASASVDGEIVTGQFQANAKSDDGATVSSEDASVAVTIPSGALENEADCKLVKEEGAEVSLPSGAELKNGPYKLVCKQADGSSVEVFKQPVKYTVNVDAEAMGNLKPALYAYQDGNWQKSDTAYNQEEGGFSYESDTAQIILVAGLKQTSIIPALVGGGVALILIVAGAIWFIRRRNSGGGDYSTDLGSASYMSAATTPDPVAAGSTTPTQSTTTFTPAAPPAPNPVNAEPPGQHGIHVPGEVQAPFAGQQDPSMPSVTHHSPLDRLNDQSTAGSADQPPK